MKLAESIKSPIAWGERNPLAWVARNRHDLGLLGVYTVPFTLPELIPAVAPSLLGNLARPFITKKNLRHEVGHAIICNDCDYFEPLQIELSKTGGKIERSGIDYESLTEIEEKEALKEQLKFLLGGRLLDNLYNDRAGMAAYIPDINGERQILNKLFKNSQSRKEKLEYLRYYFSKARKEVVDIFRKVGQTKIDEIIEDFYSLHQEQGIINSGDIRTTFKSIS